MDRSIYLSMAGAKATMQRQEVVANNLANVSTNGFRADLTAFRAVPVQGSGASTRVYALESTPGFNAETGPQQATGRNLDVAMSGNAWLAVQGVDGTEGYTRAGHLDVSAEGVLVMPNGAQVLGDGGPINVPTNARVEIASDGTVSAARDGEKPRAIGRLKLVTPTAEQPLERSADGLFRSAQGDLELDRSARLQSGSLEGSNVNAVESMVAMIAAARQFEQQMKTLQTAQEKEQAAGKLLSNQT